MDRLEFLEDLRAGAPQHDHATGTGSITESFDVVHELSRELELGVPGLDVWPRQPAHVALIEDRWPGLESLEFSAHGGKAWRLDDARMQRSFVRALGENVPAPEHDIVEAGKRHEILDQGRVVVRALAESNRTDLSQRADRTAE